MPEHEESAYRPPGRPRSVEADAAIHRATLELVTEYGCDAATLDAIAERAGVGRATIYRRYQNKDKLLAAALESVIGTLQAPDSGDTGDDVATLLCQMPPEAPNFARLLAAVTIKPLQRAAGRDPSSNTGETPTPCSCHRSPTRHD